MFRVFLMLDHRLVNIRLYTQYVMREVLRGRVGCGCLGIHGVIWY